MHFVVVRNPRVICTITYVDDLPVEIQELLGNFVDIVVDELHCSLPPIRSISHHIDLIPRAIFPNKEAYRLTLLSLCNLPKAVEAVTEATSKPLRVSDLALQDSERDLSVRFRFVWNRILG
jgi:hypothetical protein